MLVAQLKSSHRPLNFGEFTPRLARKTSRAFTASPGPSGALSARGPLAASSGPSASASPSASLRNGLALARAASPSPVSARSLPRPGTAGTAVGPDGETSSYKGLPGKLVVEHKVFSNRNSYRGSWLDRRMHGEGLYTWADGSEYSGEFREGSIWGRGEKRWPNGRRYRGEWVRDMMWGEGEMVWPSGETFTGQFRKGIFHGKGTRVWPSGDWYAGEFKNGEQEGEGTFESAGEGWVYNGHWLHGRMFGEGRVNWPNGISYVGEWVDGIREGRGRLTWPDGSWYEGQFKNNCIEGRGRKSLPDGSWFDGHFHGGELEGHGTFHWADGTEFEGLWHNSEVVGPGRHRFPDGTTITGVFEDRGASGEGTKRWANGCSYTGNLHQNQIHHYGVLKWPDGRCYIGHFKDETMHGEGMLTWSDKDGLCRYKGGFERNAFHGEGVLEWSNKARYAGEFRDGLYHGEGVFEWPDKLNVYRGQWERGEMCNRGVLACSGDLGGAGASGRREPFVYVGEFRRGHMEGKGHATFLVPQGRPDQYKGEFQASMFHGHGTFWWSSGHSLSGLFDENHCSRVGTKVYPGGQVYHGELHMDMEHGKGVLVDGDFRLIGVWRDGCCVEELIETFVPALELDAIEGDDWQRVFGGIRAADLPAESRPVIPQYDAAGEVVEGEAVVLYVSGDKYVGHVKAGKKDGMGMYVYSDLSTYKGEWVDDVMDGVRHPVPEEERPQQVLKLHKLNEKSQEMVERLRRFPLTEGKGAGKASADA